MSGFRPWPQNMPVKSSKAKSIPQLHQNRSASTTQSAKQKINQVFNQLKKLKLNNVNKFLKTLLHTFAWKLLILSYPTQTPWL